ncbi:winged helix DNA-binding domain-containing protein, partial [Meredithblackwellia eburnea MCA 4105]
MVSSEWLAELIAWGYDGASFSVLNPQEFARSVLPQYFKHSNFQSFVLTLRTTRWVHHPNAPGPSSGNQAEGPWEFKHPFFKRDSPELLSQVKRKS